jgi:predicted DNA-binding transcriptional regulator AlpA
MPVTIKISPSKTTTPTPAVRSRITHTRPGSVAGLNLAVDDSRVQVKHMLTLLGIKHSTLYEWIGKGRLPEPDARLGKKPMWWAATVRKILTSKGLSFGQPSADQMTSKPVFGSVDK